jgi:hypothetical protein
LGALHDLFRSHGDRVAFYVVYIREAHPEDGWAFTMNREEGIAIYDPATDEARAEVATTCALRLELELPVLVDRVDDAVARAYGGWPDRLYLVAADGTIAYQGGEGPDGFKPDELAEALLALT